MGKSASSFLNFYRESIGISLISLWLELSTYIVGINRLEICRDRHTRRSCKNISNCVIFSWKQRVSLQNLRMNMKFTHFFGEFTHPFLQRYWNLIFLIIHIEIYVVQLLAKLVPIYAFLVSKILGTKIWACKIFDKFQVWARNA